jgi:hypothetical protein
MAHSVDRSQRPSPLASENPLLVEMARNGADAQALYGCCQGKGGSVERGARRPLASGDLHCKRAPLRQCGRASLFVNLPTDEMSLLIEEIVDPCVN